MQEPDFPLQQVLCTAAKDSTNIFLISKRNMVLTICTTADFTYIEHRRNYGHTGADIFILIVIWICRRIYIIKLYGLVKDKDYFVITTNVDHCFQRAGFDKKRLFYTQGDYGLFQCSTPCCQETFDNEEIIKAMYEQQKDMKIPSNLIPKCPHCGKPLTTNLRCDDKFVQDNGWYKASERYSDFIRRHKDLNVLYLEIGVGYNTPVIIKYPFWRMTAQNLKSIYACINKGDADCPEELEHQSICIDADIAEVINHIL